MFSSPCSLDVPVILRPVCGFTKVIVAFVIAAILTPPDVLSQMSLALPLIALYEGSIWSVRMVEKRVARERAEAAAKPAE